MADKEAAERLRQVMTVARAASGYGSWLEVADAARVSPTTLDNWLYGRTRPQLAVLARVAAVLGASVAEWEAAYEGIAPPQIPVTDAIRELVPRLDRLLEALEPWAGQLRLEEELRALGQREWRARHASRDEPPSEPPDETPR